MHWSEERPWAPDTITGPSLAFQLNPHDQEVACSGPWGGAERPLNSEEISIVIYKVHYVRMLPLLSTFYL